MPKIDANGIRIEFDTFGDRRAEPLVLVMGLGGQMLLWDDAFCEALASRGHWVIRFDNRDIGLSTHFDSHPAPDLMQLMTALASGKAVELAYTLDDMADDAVGLIDSLGLDDAHFVGASMGGMIVQTVAIRHPARVRSLTSIMSTTGNPAVPPARPELMARLGSPPPVGKQATIDAGVETWRLISGSGYPFDEALIRERTSALYDRSHHPEGQARQLAAILAHGNRAPKLAAVRAPTLVIHGTDDPLVHVDGGKDTAAAIPGAELLLIDGMGHDLPKALQDRLVDAIATHTQKAVASRARR